MVAEQSEHPEEGPFGRRVMLAILALGLLVVGLLYFVQGIQGRLP